MPGGSDLMFCNHHAQQYEEQLRKVAVRIIESELPLDDDVPAAQDS